MSRNRQILDELRAAGNLRQLRTTACRGAYVESLGERFVNLSSNDYLGISDGGLQQQFLSEIDPKEFIMSTPSSRLMTGNSPEYQKLETTLANLYGTEAALVLGSGYLLNSGLLGAITTEADLIISDKYMHASAIDGMRLSRASHERYRHNDMNHLEAILRRATQQKKIVVTESLFSMDGDRAPLDEIARLQKQYGFELYLDEAHAFGVWGKEGMGLARECPELRVDYIVATFGKAICSQGAFVACTQEKKELLVNRMRTLIYSTALPPINLRWTQYIIDRLRDFEPERQHLRKLIGMMNGQTQIIPHIIGDNHLTMAKAEQLHQAGYWVSAVRPPTVPVGTSRLRISLTAAHTEQQITELCRLLG